MPRKKTDLALVAWEKDFFRHYVVGEIFYMLFGLSQH